MSKYGYTLVCFKVDNIDRVITYYTRVGRRPSHSREMCVTIRIIFFRFYSYSRCIKHNKQQNK